MGAVAALPQALGLIDNLAMGLLAKHEARIQIAKEENAAVQQAVAALDADLHTIFTAANVGDLTTTAAIAACMAVDNWYWQFITPFQQGSQKGNTCGTMAQGGPGIAPDTPGQRGACYSAPGAPCSGKACTAGCCIGCQVINASLANAVYLFRTGKAGAISVCTVIGNKYGLQTRHGYVLSYKPPPRVTEEEVTINNKTGLVSIGAPPSTIDSVVTAGVVVKGAQADQGGVAGVTSGGVAQKGYGEPGAVVNGIDIGGHFLTYAQLGIGAAVIFAGLLLFGGRRTA